MQHDVYCFGHVSTGVILRLKGRYPQADGYAEIAETLENHAGEATGTALVLAGFGVRVAIEGNWIGDTPACRRTLRFLQSRGIDCAGLLVKQGYAGVNEVVVSDGESRTVFGRYIDLLFTTPQWEPPHLERIRAARLVCVDPSFGAATLAVARAAKKAGLPLVTSDARHDTELASLADAIVLSNELIGRDYPEALLSREARESLFEDYRRVSPGLVVFTDGARPVWYARGHRSPSGVGQPSPGQRLQLEPPEVEVVDSAGAGDSFRAGVIFGMLHGWPDEVTLRFASAVASLICMRAPGCVNPPTLDEVNSFLAAHGLPTRTQP